MTQTASAPTHPDARIIQAIYDLDLGRVGWMAKLICYRGNEQIKFGKDLLTVAAFCERWKVHKASGFRVQVWAGPPAEGKWYSLTMASFVVDWYFKAIAMKNEHVVKKMTDMLLENKL